MLFVTFLSQLFFSLLYNLEIEFLHAHAMSALIALGTELARVRPSHVTSKNRSVVQQKGGTKTKSSCFFCQFLSTAAGV